jgi:hypothetical protein
LREKTGVFRPFLRGNLVNDKGIFSAFMLALMAEMFGIPFLFYLLSPLFGIPVLSPTFALLNNPKFFGWPGMVAGAWLTLRHGNGHSGMAPNLPDRRAGTVRVVCKDTASAVYGHIFDPDGLAAALANTTNASDVSCFADHLLPAGKARGAGDAGRIWGCIPEILRAYSHVLSRFHPARLRRLKESRVTLYEL